MLTCGKVLFLFLFSFFYSVPMAVSLVSKTVSVTQKTLKKYLSNKWMNGDRPMAQAAFTGCDYETPSVLPGG